MTKNKPRISVIGQVYPLKGGISHYNSLLCNELQSRSDLEVISFLRIFPKWLHPLKSNKDNLSANFLKGEAKFIFDVPNPFSWPKVVNAIVEHRPQAVIFHWYTPILAVPFWFVISRLKRKIPGLRIICICHNALPHEKTLADKFLTRLALRGADTVVVHSEKDSENIRNLLPAKKVLKLFHPVYDFFYRPVSQEEARKNLELDSQGNVILFFGGIRKYKGLEYLLQAVEKVLNEMPVKLIIAGEFFGNKDSYIQKISELSSRGAVKLYDRYILNDEVANFFSAADLVVAPYISGTQSGALNVALAFGKPMIATRVGGFLDIVIDGKTGYLVEPRNSDALAEATIKFFTKDRHKDFASEIKKLKKQLSWEILAQKIIEESQNFVV